MRHVLDAFTSIFNGLESGRVDFSDRKRNTISEVATAEGIRYFQANPPKAQAPLLLKI